LIVFKKEQYLFLERGVASMLQFLLCTVVSASYLPDNELEGKGGWRDPVHDIKGYQANIVNIEWLLFSFKRKGATKQ
jgi:hypothetical protein